MNHNTRHKIDGLFTKTKARRAKKLPINQYYYFFGLNKLLNSTSTQMSDFQRI